MLIQVEYVFFLSLKNNPQLLFALRNQKGNTKQYIIPNK